MVVGHYRGRTQGGRWVTYAVLIAPLLIVALLSLTAMAAASLTTLSNISIAQSAPFRQMPTHVDKLAVGQMPAYR
jgi:hypothetical protein